MGEDLWVWDVTPCSVVDRFHVLEERKHQPTRRHFTQNSTAYS